MPWHLSDVLSGAPIILDPFIEQARYAAEMRNYYWQYQRGSGAVTGIESPKHVHPYPPPKMKSSDKAVKDSGGNFGRVARVHGLMDEFIEAALATPISGIECRHWIDFFTVFTDASDPEQIDEKLKKLLAKQGKDIDAEKAEKVIEHLRALQSALSDEPEPE